MTNLIKDLRRDKEFMRHFSNAFFKKLTPKNYFWNIYSTYDNPSFKLKFDEQLNRIKAKILKPDKIKKTDAALISWKTKREETMELLMCLKKPNVNDNEIYLK